MATANQMSGRDGTNKETGTGSPEAFANETALADRDPALDFSSIIRQIDFLRVENRSAKGRAQRSGNSASERSPSMLIPARVVWLSLSYVLVGNESEGRTVTLA